MRPCTSLVEGDSAANRHGLNPGNDPGYPQTDNRWTAERSREPRSLSDLAVEHLLSDCTLGIGSRRVRGFTSVYEFQSGLYRR